MILTLTKMWQQNRQETGMERTSQYEDGSTPRQWQDQEFTPDEATAWRLAGAFDAEKARELADADFDPDELSAVVTEADKEKFNIGYSGYSIAYVYCNGDLTLEQLKQIIQ